MSITPIQALDFLEVKLVSYCRDQVALNILHYLVAGAQPGPVPYSALAAGINAQFAPLMKACMSVDAQWIGVTIRSILPLPLGVEYPDKSAPGVGTFAGEVLPLQVTGIITKRTARPGGHYRGRMYVPFPSESASSTNGVPTDPYKAVLQTLATFLPQVLVVTVGPNEVQLNLIVLSSDPLLDTTLVTNCVVQPRFATQRRRGSYGRPNPIPF